MKSWPIVLRSAGVALLFLLFSILMPTRGSAQTPDGYNWTRSPSNPILVRGQISPFSNLVVVNNVRFENGIYRMWANISSSDHVDKVGHFTSADGVTWTFDRVVLDLGGPTYGGVGHHCIIKDDGVYRMWYSGRGVSNLPAGRHAVGYATSTDGMTWTDLGKVFDIDGAEIYGMKVIKDGALFKLWFGFDLQVSYLDSKVGYASSPDGINWSYYGPAVAPGSSSDLDRYQLGVTEISKQNDTYGMWYWAAENYSPPEHFRVFYATSADGINWTKRGVVLSGSSATFEDRGVGGPGAIMFGNPTKFWYGSVGSAYDWCVSYAQGVIVSPPPTISSFSPISGSTGTVVTINGTHFSPTASNDIVYFGAVRATVTGATATLLTVTVPTGATYRPITVTVNGLTAFSSKPFTVTFPGGGTLDANSFAAKVDFPVGNQPEELAIADIDGDGKPDLAVGDAATGNSSASVLRNISSAGAITANSFLPRVVLAAENPYGTTAADVDGDGKLDLILVNSGASRVALSVYRNISTTGSITTASFDIPVDFSIPYGPSSSARNIAVGDLDGDGKPDLVLANVQGNTVSVFRNTSTVGSISFSSAVTFSVGLYPTWAAIGDIDGDGKPDLVIANDGGASVSVLQNTSSPGQTSFAPKVDFEAAAGVFSVALADMDGDGKLDVVTSGTNTVAVLRNTSTTGAITAASFAPKVEFSVGYVVYGIAVGDLDGDGKPDIVAGNFLSTSVSVLRNTSISGSITADSFAPKVDFGTGFNPYMVAIGDLDGDGRPDLAVTNYGSNSVTVLRNTMQAVNRPPVANAGPSQTVECTSPTATLVQLNGSASSDPDGDQLTFTWVGPFGTASGATPTVTLPMGTNTITLTVDDGRGGVSSAQVIIRVVDTKPPVITLMPPATMWPPNHKVLQIQGVCDGEVGS